MKVSPGPTFSLAGTQNTMTSTSASVVRTMSLSRSPSNVRGLCSPGVSITISCASARCTMPRTACRVVCGRSLVIATFCPTSALSNVDLPAFGRPTTQAKPERWRGVTPSVSPMETGAEQSRRAPSLRDRSGISLALDPLPELTMRTHTGLDAAAHTDPSAVAAHTIEFAAIVVGHDGHHSAKDDALRYAIQLAARLDTHLHVIHSVTIDDYGIDPDTAAFEEECARNLAIERQRINALFENTTIRWTYHEERGDPADRLAQVAASVNAACIIVGSHPHGIARGLLGADSVPRWLLHHQPRPVLVVPAG